MPTLLRLRFSDQPACGRHDRAASGVLADELRQRVDELPEHLLKEDPTDFESENWSSEKEVCVRSRLVAYSISQRQALALRFLCVQIRLADKSQNAMQIL